jgi:chromosome segregation ATPase
MGFFKRLMRWVVGPDDAGLVHCDREHWLLIIEQNVANNSRLLHKLDFDRKAAEFSLATQAVSQAQEIQKLRNETSSALAQVGTDIWNLISENKELRKLVADLQEERNRHEQILRDLKENSSTLQAVTEAHTDSIDDLQARLGDHETRFASRTGLLGAPSNN